MLTEKIKKEGGFTKLDKVIRQFRKNSAEDLELANFFQNAFGFDLTLLDSFTNNEYIELGEYQAVNQISASSDLQLLEINTTAEVFNNKNTHLYYPLDVEVS